MLLAPGEVVVVVNLVDGLGAEDLQHRRDDDVASGIRVVAGELHRGHVRLAELGADLEEHGRGVHLALARLAVERETLRQREEARRGPVAEAAGAEVDADPDEALLILHQVDVVVAGANGAQLRLRQLRELALGREFRATDPVEHRVVGLLLGRDAHAEGDPPRDLAHQALDAAESVQIGARELRPGRLVAAADVVADARGRDVALVRDAAADRLGIARVVVGAEDAELGVAGLHTALELGEAACVDRSKGLDLHRFLLAV
jgi:hypothetical protein